MESGKFIDMKEVEIGERKFAISRIPALKALAIYNDIVKSVSDNGAVGITMMDSDAVRAILSYTAVSRDDSWLSLDTAKMIEDTFTDVEEMLELVMHMVRENFSFLADGGLRKLLEIPAGAATESGS